MQGGGPFAALFVQPRSWNGNGELLRPALRGAEANEKYGFLPYQTPYSPLRGREHDVTADVKLDNYLETSKEYLGQTYEVAKDLDAAIRMGLSVLQMQEGRRHLFVLVDPSVGDAGAVSESVPTDYAGVHVHSIVWDNAKPELSDSLRKLSLASGGRFAQAASGRDFIRRVVAVRASQFGSFELVWRPRQSGSNDPVRISCFGPYGSGEVLLRTNQSM